MSALVVGVDVGGTKAAVRAALVEGPIVVDTVVSSDEWDAEPVDRAADWLDRVLRAALPADAVPAAVVVGAQGLDRDDIAEGLRRALTDLGYERVACLNDAALLVPAAGLDDGLALIAGTGAIGIGRDATGRHFVTGGWGWVLGDDAGAAGLVREATKAALLAHDDGASDDGLLGALLSSFGVSDAERLARRVNDEPTMANWGPHAPAVFAAANDGSALAVAVIDAGARHLVRLVDQLRSRGALGATVVAGGSVIVRQPRLFESLRRILAERHPDLDVLLLPEPPVAGALALARDLVR